MVDFYLQEKLLNFNNYLEKRKEEISLKGETFGFLKQIVRLLQDYSSIITTNPKQILNDTLIHLGDYVSDFSLAPIGSFALDCMRNEKLSVDLLASFTRIMKISDEEFLKLFCDCLKECSQLNLGRDQGSNFRMSFSIPGGSYIEVKAARDSVGEVIFKISISRYPSLDQDPAIIHIKSMNDCLKNIGESFGDLRVLMSLMRSWREKSQLFFLAPEIMDIVLLTEFFSNNVGNLAYYVEYLFEK